MGLQERLGCDGLRCRGLGVLTWGRPRQGGGELLGEGTMEADVAVSLHWDREDGEGR